jgi:O-antigen ligase
MLKEAGIQKNTLQTVGIVFMLISLVVFVYTGKYLVLLLPFGALMLTLFAANWKAAWWIFLFSIPVSMQISFLGDTLSTSLPDEPMMWLFLLTFIVLFASRPDILPEWFWRNPIVLILVCQYLWTIVSVIFSQEQFISVKFLAAKTWFLVSYVLLPVLIFRRKKDFKRGFLLFLTALLISMAAVLIRHASMGFAYLKINKAIGIIYYNRVDYSTVMSMFFPVLIAAVPLLRGFRLWWKVLLILIIIIFMPAIYLTFARGAMMAVVFALLMGLAIRMKLAKLAMPAFFALMILAVAYMTRNNKYMSFRPNFEHTYTHLTFTDHLVATFRGEDMSSMERLYRWIAGARMSLDRPLVGVGPNAFYDFYKPYAVTSFRTYVSRNPERSTTHNYFLFMLVEQGWPAMILYAILLAVFFIQAQNIYHRFKDRFYRNVTLAIAMMFAAGFINNFFSELLETHKVGALFYMSIALMIVLRRKSMQEKEAIESGDEAQLAEVLA